MAELAVGGQAVIEGVMMRSPHCLAVAVRAPSGGIVLRRRPWISLAERWRFLRWPFCRGILVLAESLHNGISALNFSARVQEESSGARENPVSLWVTLGLAFVLALGLFAALPHFLTWALGALAGSESLSGGRSVTFHVVDGVIKFGIFLGYIVGISRIPDIRRVFMFHGAEHKSIYAFEKQEELTVENALKHTTLHPRCGTAFLLLVLVVAILIFTVVFPFVPAVSSVGFVNQLFFVLIKLFLLFPIAGMAYEVIRLAGKRPNSRWLRAAIWPGLMMQKLTTGEPEAAMVEVALVSLRTVLAAEKQYVESASAIPESQEEFASYASYLGKSEGV
jgi:uncharacterized protein YqhQ